MNWTKLKFLALDALVIVARYWYLLLALAVFVCVLWGIESCRARRTEKKIERIETNITIRQTEANVLANERTNVRAEINAYEQNSNLALDNFNRAVGADSANYKGTDAGRRFCERFPQDSSCR